MKTIKIYMNKTLHRTPHSCNKSNAARQAAQPEDRMVSRAMKNMQDVWQQASEELLQPRPEAVANLLKRIAH
jgi:hypothetical protein